MKIKKATPYGGYAVQAVGRDETMQSRQQAEDGDYAVQAAGRNSRFVNDNK